jgi:response regulator RpfG family c-di-GMP phosphodiesterase
VRGAATSDHGQDIEILAFIHDQDDPQRSEAELTRVIALAKERKASVVENDISVGYYPSSVGSSVLLALRGVGELDEIDQQLLRIFSNSVSMAFENIRLNQEMLDTQGELIHRLGEVVESRSNEAGAHVKRMAEVSYMLALAHGLDPEEAEIIRRAAPMHDIGKIATPDSILLKEGKLSALEWDVMRKHPETGHSILAGSRRPIIAAASVIAHQHHEKFDGSGYPRGLSGEDIHVYARIIAVADVFDALTHERCYKPAWTVEDAVQHMLLAAGTHFDPTIVQLLMANIDKATAINAQYPG